ncbi:amino acid/polyamine/organocation transporter (APC superfamily) [Isoptericola sp. CG 20/1183]|uniref:Amino acid/polyamine/organocation transporter (APC superfamily) n=1 Tax=Isoptericola halotolerans TaxID=300560 RepID=A0ABX5ECD3_9MICO|nr:MULTISPECIES: APC family permease [Isoptericola]PRZ02672.1 amino acid/polyamine/organocation transporter (APC superfamily) [Isoptericola sp. CG 20/1183]PRZ03024.1 amino acid/polyamine/organocation transporter (APC superfamily) [Isoptericola halotolerans]
MSGTGTSSPTGLRRAVTGPLLFLFILGDVLGAGVYALIGEMAGDAGGLVWLSFGVALGLALLTAFSYAELVTKYPRAGGSAVYAEKAYRSPLVAFLVGYCMLAAGVVSAAGLSLAFTGEYLTAFLPVPQVPAAIVFLLVVALVNAWGIKESLRANVVMTVVEAAGLVLVTVLGAWVIGRGDADLGGAFTPPEGSSVWLAVLGSALVAFYSFVGFETSANLAEEIRDVSRVYPRALFGSLATAGAVYVVLGFVAPAVVAPAELAASSGPLLEVVRVAGAVPPELFAVIALVAIANGALLTMIMASRLAYGMARQGLLPAPLGRVLPRRRTPGVAILVTTALAVVLAATNELIDLASTVVLLLLFVFLSTNVAVLVLRRDTVAHDHFRAPSVMPVLAVLSCLLLLTQQELRHWALAGVLLAVGVGLHLVMRRLARSSSTSASAA